MAQSEKQKPRTIENGRLTRWLITGGCGFIGTRLIRHLMKKGGHAVRVLDNLSVGTRQELSEVCDFTEIDPAESLFSEASGRKPFCELMAGDITDPAVCFQAAENMDVIVHLAANTGVGPSVADPRKDFQTNVIGTFNMLEAARQNGAERFVFASSGAPLGECQPPIHEEMAAHPASPYGAGKLAGEGYCSAFFQSFGLNTVVLRFGNVYGPGATHKNSVVAKFIKQAGRGEPLEIYGDGNQTRDFIYIDDLVEAIILSRQTENIGGEIFQIATNRETTIREMVETLIPILKAAGINEVRVIHGERRIGDVRRNFSDTTKAERLLGWQCTYTLQQGLEETVRFFIKRCPGGA